FQGTAGGEDHLRQIGRRVGQWRPCYVWHGWGGWDSGDGGTSPDQDSAVFVHSQLFGVDHVVFEVCEQLIIELQPALEHAIGYALLRLEKGEHRGQDGIIVHIHAPRAPGLLRSVAARRSLPSTGTARWQQRVRYGPAPADPPAHTACRGRDGSAPGAGAC